MEIFSIGDVHPKRQPWSLIEIYLTLDPDPILSSDKDIKITQSLGFEYFMGHEYFILRFSRLTILVRLILLKPSFANIFHFYEKLFTKIDVRNRKYK